MLDEWSASPNEPQPLLADLLRRFVIPREGFDGQDRSNRTTDYPSVASERGDYTGIELGADVAADINLDDFMVFENDARRATEFFQELLYRHYKSAAEDLGQTEVLPNSDELIRQPLLTSSPIPEALVHAESAAVLGRCASQIIASSSARFLAE